MGDNGKYSHQEFKIGAADEKGHVERLQLRVPPIMLGKMQRVINSHKWPYETYQELIRHAIMKQLNWLETDNPEVGNLTSQISSMVQMMNQELDYQTMEETYTKMRAVFQKNLSISGEESKRRNLLLVCELWREINKIDDVFWRRVWTDRFKSEYEKVLASVPGIDLGQMEEREEE